MEWTNSQPSESGLYFASKSGAYAAVRYESGDRVTVLVGKIDAPKEWLEQAAPGYEPELDVSCDFYDFWYGPVDTVDESPPPPPNAR